MSSNPLNSFYSCKHSALHKRQLIHLGAGNECLAMIIRARSILITPHSLKKNSGIYLFWNVIPSLQLYWIDSLMELFESAAKLTGEKAKQYSKICGVSRQLHSPLCAFLLSCSSHYFVFLSNHYHCSNGIILWRTFLNGFVIFYSLWLVL